MAWSFQSSDLGCWGLICDRNHSCFLATWPDDPTCSQGPSSSLPPGPFLQSQESIFQSPCGLLTEQARGWGGTLSKR